MAWDLHRHILSQGHSGLRNRQLITKIFQMLHFYHKLLIQKHYIDGLVQYCINSIANVLELLQACTKPLIPDNPCASLKFLCAMLCYSVTICSPPYGYFTDTGAIIWYWDSQRIDVYQWSKPGP